MCVDNRFDEVRIQALNQIKSVKKSRNSLKVQMEILTELINGILFKVLDMKHAEE